MPPASVQDIGNGARVIAPIPALSDAVRVQETGAPNFRSPWHQDGNDEALLHSDKPIMVRRCMLFPLAMSPFSWGLVETHGALVVMALKCCVRHNRLPELAFGSSVPQGQLCCAVCTALVIGSELTFRCTASHSRRKFT